MFVTFDGTHGAGPQSPPIQGSDGNFYGTTFEGGAQRFGTVYQVTPQGGVTVLHNFCSQSNCADGSFPVGGLVEGNDGNFYGTTSQGGAHNVGIVFVISAGGSFNVLHSFTTTGGDGINPYAGLVKGQDGNFYGTTKAGGNGGGQSRGTVFKITPAGVLTTLYRFCSVGACTDGADPYSPLVLASDGNFYGTTSAGGHDTCVFSCGTVFKITPDGTLTTLYSFSQSDGAEPLAGLAQASDGNLYGTTWMGGTSSGCGGEGCGTVFKITLNGAFTNLYNFCTQSNCADGRDPYYGTLVQASDGLLYGTTWQGGSDNTCSNGCGVLFRIELGGRFTTVHSFTRTTDGASPFAGLTQASDGKLYGTTTFGGNNGLGQGTIYRYAPPIPPMPVQFIAATPCRVVDTRGPNGPFGGPVMQGNTSRSFTLPQSPDCQIPSSAAYSLNVTVAPRGPLGYLTIWPTGQDQPGVSTLNSPDGRVKANAAIVPAGTNGAISVYVTNTTDVIIDVDGYFATPGQNTNQFYPLPPCRIIDTRGPDGHLGGPYLHGGAERDFPVLESPCLAGLDQPQAYSLNFTVVPHRSGQSLGYLSVWPVGQQQPVVSTLNNPTATTVANAAIVPAGTDGAIATYVSNDTELIVDINGYFAAPSQNGTSLYPVSPCRAYDSRDNGGQPFRGARAVDIVESPCAPSVNAQAYVLNATVVPRGALGYLTLWPDGEDQPVASTLNALDGLITSNMAIVPTMNGSIDAYASSLTHLILDISGYFAP
ncbi:MAG TPA: choice-of-anchor tandem repeat GloVer-containing protein [Candidatus Binatia bacterium]|nr:choice-of-anchor tandem repeat GloVer-containing protein [Candidatus Binatia bacterium]